MYKHLSCAPFKIKLTTGSSNAGTSEKLLGRSRSRTRQKAGMCASTQTLACFLGTRHAHTAGWLVGSAVISRPPWKFKTEYVCVWSLESLKYSARSFVFVLAYFVLIWDFSHLSCGCLRTGWLGGWDKVRWDGRGMRNVWGRRGMPKKVWTEKF